MLFNSLVFVGFFLAVYGLYLLVARRLRLQNALLFAASYVFYGYWDWRFLSLIAISTLTDFIIGRALGRQGDGPEAFRRRKLLLATSMVVNLSLLGFFKYFGFFADSFVKVMHAFGFQADAITLNIILPVGISFYTFQTMSYTIDVYRRRLEPTHNLLDFAVFVAFFPQLVAGPIERARNLLPQVMKPRRITVAQINAGLYLVLWGYFKKVVIADNVGKIADTVFAAHGEYAGLDVIVAVLAFSVQIYGDFSGYSDIARGIARLMGFELMVNFRLPYFALSPSDFWRRWHISLSSWLRDYLYIPLGGNRGGALRTQCNLLVTMLLGGLWHGAAWPFVIWGAFHGVILILYRIFDRRPCDEDPWNGRHPVALVVAKMLLMSCLTLVGWLIFRSTSVAQIGQMLGSLSLATSPSTSGFLATLVFFTAPLVIVQVWQYVTRDLLVLTKLPVSARVPIYAFLFVWILIFGVRESLEFIYFQF